MAVERKRPPTASPITFPVFLRLTFAPYESVSGIIGLDGILPAQDVDDQDVGNGKDKKGCDYRSCFRISEPVVSGIDNTIETGSGESELVQ